MRNLLIFWFGTIIGILTGVMLCRIHKFFMHLFFFLLVFATLHSHWSITFSPKPGYRATSKGFEVHVVDVCSVILGTSMLFRKEEYKIKWIPPLTVPVFLFLIVSLISWGIIYNTYGYEIPNAHRIDVETGQLLAPSYEIGLYPFFEMFTILKGYFIYWVVFNFFNNEKVIKIMILSCGMLSVYSAIGNLYQRYVQKLYRTGFYIDFNVLGHYAGMLGGFLNPFIFQIRSLYRSSIVMFCVLCSLVSIFLSVSRSAIVAFLLAVFPTGVLSFFRFLNFKGLVLASVVTIGFLLIFAKGFNTITERFTSENIAGGESIRREYIKEAMVMVESHFFGVGLGNFSAFASTIFNKLVGANLGSALAHNIWYLTLAETGWPGLLIFIIYWLRYLQMILVTLFSKEIRMRPVLCATALGLCAVAIVMVTESFFHFSYRVNSVFMLFQVFAGLTGRLYLSTKIKSMAIREET